MIKAVGDERHNVKSIPVREGCIEIFQWLLGPAAAHGFVSNLPRFKEWEEKSHSLAPVLRIAALPDSGNAE
jgi:hypothetical protein